MSFSRANRVGEEIRKEVSQLIREELKDPRLGFLTITSVEVTNDLRYSKIFVSIFGNEEAKKNTLSALKSAAGFLRSELGKRLRLRYTPDLLFHFDESIEHGAKMSKLINEVIKADEEGKKNEQ